MTTADVGQNVRKLRTKMGLSQKAFGALIGKSESQISAYETSTTTMTLDTLFEIAKAGKVKPEDILRGFEEKNESKGWDAELRIYNMEDRKQVMTILAVNGYDVGQHKRKATPTGKTVEYYVHATDRKENADTSK